MNPTVLHHLREHARTIPELPAYGVKRDDQWQTRNWREYVDQVFEVARALMALDLPAGGRVAIFGNNHPEWAIFCLGTMAARGVSAGIYPTCSAEQVAYIVGHAEASVILVEGEEQYRKVEAVWDDLPHLRHVVTMGSRPLSGAGDASDGRRVWTWQQLIARADETSAEQLEARFESITGGDTATLIYTSGTTGQPKAVMLCHSNLLETGRIGNQLHNLQPGDSIISYLPMAHVAEQMMSVHMPAYVAYTVYYVEKPEQLLENLQELQPTIFFAVPRVWEKFHAGITGRLESASPLARRILAAGSWVGRRYSEALNRGRSPGPVLSLLWSLADRVVMRKLRSRIGLSNVRVAASGAAPITREILDFFSGVGVRIYEVYGLSESCGPGTWNRAGRTRLGTVGPVIPEVEMRIADDGEVLFRGPNVFQGYFKDEAATADTKDPDGWLHTGDIGEVDGEGFLSITGRKKELIITSGGKNIAPAGIESRLKELELVGDAMVIGDDRRFLTALLTLEEEAAHRFAESRRSAEIEGALREAVREGIQSVNRKVARVETVRNFRLLPRRLTVEEGELTPTLKIKRGVVAERYSDQIEAMYAEGQVIEPER